MIEYDNSNPEEPEFLQQCGNWYKKTWRLSLYQNCIVMTDEDTPFDLDITITMISFWSSDDYKTQRRFTLPKTWEWA